MTPEPDPEPTAPEPRRLARATLIVPPDAAPDPVPDPTPDLGVEGGLPLARRSQRPLRRVASTRPPSPPSTRPLPPPLPPLGPLVIVLVTFAGMMAVSFGQALHGLLSAADRVAAVGVADDGGARRDLIRENLVFEGIDTLLVVVALALAGRPLRQNAAWVRYATWLGSVPGLALLLAVNFAYHALLIYLVKDPNAPVEEVIDLTLRDGAVWAILLTCLQPAVVEELFFRYLLLGHLRPHLGLHGAVWLSSVVFGMAHLGNIAGWPVLILIGAGLGYARVMTGGLTLPILLHFCHNYAVLLADDLGY